MDKLAKREERRLRKLERKRKKEEKKMIKKKKRKRKSNVAKAQAQAYAANNKLKIVMPRDEELETSNSELSDDAGENGEDSRALVRPVSKQMMRERAARLQGRRDEIKAFLGMHQSKRRNLMAFSEFLN